jgi:hypothetical protein
MKMSREDIIKELVALGWTPPVNIENPRIKELEYEITRIDTNHVFHFILTFFRGFIWAFVWVSIGVSNMTKRRVLRQEIAKLKMRG